MTDKKKKEDVKAKKAKDESLKTFRVYSHAVLDEKLKHHKSEVKHVQASSKKEAIAKSGIKNPRRAFMMPEPKVKA